MLRSPFPGMDPYLEINPRWEVFHGWFVRNMAAQHQAQARDLDCWIGVERSVCKRDPDHLERRSQEYLMIREGAMSKIRFVLTTGTLCGFAGFAMLALAFWPASPGVTHANFNRVQI